MRSYFSIFPLLPTLLHTPCHQTPHVTRTTSAFSPITPHTTPSHTRSVVVLTATPHITQTHRELKLQKSIPFTAGVKLLADLKQMTSVIPTIGHFYDVDKEVCGILEGCRKPHGASRPLCRNPILWTLEFSDVCPRECSTLYCSYPPLLYSMAECEEAKLFKYEGEFYI